MTSPAPTKIHYHKQSRELALTFADGQDFRLSAEYLRVHSPSAEVRGHGMQMPILQYGKKTSQSITWKALVITRLRFPSTMVTIPAFFLGNTFIILAKITTNFGKCT